MDHHLVAAELPADSRTGGIDCTGKSFHPGFFRMNGQPFTGSPSFETGVDCQHIPLNMGEKEFVLYPYRQ